MDSFNLAENSPEFFLTNFQPCHLFTDPSTKLICLTLTVSHLSKHRYGTKLYIPFPLIYALHLTCVPPGKHIQFFSRISAACSTPVLRENGISVFLPFSYPSN